MQSIKYLYQIGYGPSSSHTMGPAKATKRVKTAYPEANRFEITLFNSLALTGKGHLTEDAIIESLSGTEVTFFATIDLDMHPNYMKIKAYKNDELIIEKGVSSVGGGRIVFDGENDEIADIYPHQTFKSIKKYCKEKDIGLYDYVVEVEGVEIIEFLKKIWETMKDAIHRGTETQGVLPGPLKTKRRAFDLYYKQFKNEPSEVKENRLVSAFAYAVSEENAGGGLIVTAPTCGACGVLPAVLYYMRQRHIIVTEDRIIRALAVAGLFGNLIKHNASISGAVAGCQAEIGSACSMAAAAHATLFKLSIDQVEYAAEIAMEHHLGLTCDPINGFVQIPCIERNAVAALRAIDACGLAYFLSDSRKISFDTVVETMYQTGIDMHEAYKETSQGGLARHYKENDNDANCW